MAAGKHEIAAPGSMKQGPKSAWKKRQQTVLRHYRKTIANGSSSKPKSFKDQTRLFPWILPAEALEPSSMLKPDCSSFTLGSYIALSTTGHCSEIMHRMTAFSCRCGLRPLVLLHLSDPYEIISDGRT